MIAMRNQKLKKNKNRLFICLRIILKNNMIVSVFFCISLLENFNEILFENYLRF